MNVLVTGGAGYVGSHACKSLARTNHKPVVLDSLVYGHEWAVKWGPFYKGDIRDTEFVREIIRKEKIEAVMHFAAFAYVGESMNAPAKYYDNNVGGSLSLLEAMRLENVKRIVFSSTCATYGTPLNVPIIETTPQNPINPYGMTKLMVEKILGDYGRAYGFKSIALRYFNAAGADADGEIGEDHQPETHLIPLAIEAAFNKEKSISVFGDDYETPDGTCVRDYIHVSDLGAAHLRALHLLDAQDSEFEAYNLGTGQGLSVKEIINVVSEVAGKKVKFTTGPRRAGDPPELVASPEKARHQLGWEPQHSSAEEIITTAVNWYKKHHHKGGKK
jgi:UDP-glucose-4-epimerase GalE